MFLGILISNSNSHETPKTYRCGIVSLAANIAANQILTNSIFQPKQLIINYFLTNYILLLYHKRNIRLITLNYHCDCASAPLAANALRTQVSSSRAAIFRFAFCTNTSRHPPPLRNSHFLHCRTYPADSAESAQFVVPELRAVFAPPCVCESECPCCPAAHNCCPPIRCQPLQPVHARLDRRAGQPEHTHTQTLPSIGMSSPDEPKLSHRVRKRVREVKRKARPGKCKLGLLLPETQRDDDNTTDTK